MKDKNYGIIVAAGKGKRMGSNIKKQYLMIKDKPVIVHTVNAFLSSSLIDGLVIVISMDDYEYFKKEILCKYGLDKNIILAEGSCERQHSVYNGLKALPAGVKIVAIHDGVRPLITSDIIDESIKKAQEYGSAVVGVPVKDTIRVVDKNNFAVETPERDTLWTVQTPQTFQYEIIMSAHEKARENNKPATDDGQLVERIGKPVVMVKGSYDNIKITTVEDIVIAEQLLNRIEKNYI